MRVPGPKFLLFNAAAALAGVAAVVAAAWSVLMPAAVAPCSERYHAMTAFGLERGGVALTAADLQASLGGKDVGRHRQCHDRAAQGRAAPLAMAVSLQKASFRRWASPPSSRAAPASHGSRASSGQGQRLPEL